MDARKIWTIEINEAEVFARCTNDSLYQAYNRTEENQKGDALVIQEDDRGQFQRYYAVAIAELTMLLARNMREPLYGCGCDEEGKAVFDLFMNEDCDNNIKPILITHCYEYVVTRVLEQWYKADLGSYYSKSEINHCLHYRKNPVRRRLGPLF